LYLRISISFLRINKVTFSKLFFPGNYLIIIRKYEKIVRPIGQRGFFSQYAKERGEPSTTRGNISMSTSHRTDAHHPDDALEIWNALKLYPHMISDVNGAYASLPWGQNRQYLDISRCNYYKREFNMYKKRNDFIFQECADRRT